MLMKSLFAASLALVASSALATEVKTIEIADDSSAEVVRVWNTVCVSNLEIEGGVAGAYKWGAEGEWQEMKFEHNYQYLFRQRFPNDVEPYTLTVKFMSNDSDTGVEVSYDLEQTTTRFQQNNCANVTNYKFEAADDDSGTRDLVKAE